MISAIVFLGNPGRRYADTRHNYGWMVCRRFTEDMDVGWTEKFHGLFAETRLGGRKLLLLKPQTYMNNCGQSVQAMTRFYHLPPEDLMVVHDDLELPFGAVEVKRGGGMAGHNGLKSLRRRLGSDSFIRLRLGIGRPGNMPVSSYVLSRFSKEEEAELPDLTAKARDSIMKIVLDE